MSFPCLVDTLLAAKARVRKLDAVAHGGHKIGVRTEELCNLMAVHNFPQRSGGWKEHWYNKAFVRNLKDIDGKFAALGLSIRDLETELRSTIEEEDPCKSAMAFKKSYQRSMRAAIKGKRICDAEGRMRYKLDRWNFDAFPRVCVREALNSLRHVGKSAPPRVAAAVLGTMWNRWATSRRIKTAGRVAQCKFGCVDHEDSIEHYSVCPVIGDFAKRYLRLQQNTWVKERRLRFFLMDPEMKRETADSRTRGAILLYAVYRTLNIARHSKNPSSRVIREMLPQSAKEGVKGHAYATNLMDNWWPMLHGAVGLD